MADPNFTVPDGNEINRGNDIKPENRIKLGQYLSSRTSGNNNDSDSFVPGDYRYSPPRPNTFPISDTATDSDSSTLGDRFALPNATTNDQPAFVSNDDAINRWNSRSSEKTGWKTVTPISDPDEQGKARALHEIGNSSNKFSSNIETGVSEVLKTNAFTQDRDFRSRGQAPNRDEWPAPDSNETIKKMREEALRVLEYAAGLDKGPGFLLSNALNATPESVKRGTESLRLQDPAKNVSSFDPGVPGGANEDFYGISSQYIAIGKATNTTPDDGLGDTGGVYTGITYGTKNSAQIPYGNIAKGAETILFALAAAVAIGVAILVWSAVMTIFFRKLDRPDYRQGISPPGSERDSSVLSDLLGLLFGTKRPYNISTFEAGLVGTTSFLGINIAGGAGAGGAIAEAVINFAFSPDYYTMICRMVLNGVYSFGYQAGSGASGAAGAIAALSTLRENKLVAFVNRMIDIGSITMRGMELTSEIDASQPNEIPNMRNYFQQQDGKFYLERAVRRVSRSREKGNMLSWRTSSSAMALLMPTSFVNGSATMSEEGGASGVTAWADRIGKGVPYASKDASVTDDDNFINSEYADTVERALNAEYVPFYFRDLRTNEIISFHAFLEDLSDSFAASYTAVEGFGRQDPVQIYKGTTRSIGLSFSVVSTSPKDHDVMWYKINRLVAMLYPQYSDGITVNDGSNNKFDVPFSQVYSASPLIRMRIGDVISSNYSRFGLARLFGLGKKDRVFHSTADPSISLDGVNKKAKDELDAFLNSKTKASTEQEESSVTVEKSDDSIPNLFNSKNASLIRGGVFRGTNELLGDTYQVQLRPGTQVSVGDIKSVPALKSGTLPGDRNSGNSNVAFAKLKKSIKVNAKTATGSDTIVDINYVYIPYALLEYKMEADLDIPTVGGAIGLSKAGVITATQEFFSAGSNAIVRSFESSMGRGLAGVITSLSMDWNEATWETDRPGSKAPIWLKITLQFAPIHDLPMGLDSNGAMVAPAYPIGPVVRETHLIDRPSKSNVPSAGFSAKDDGSYTTNYNAEPLDAATPQRYTKRFI
jgi:hypothetical protein